MVYEKTTAKSIDTRQGFALSFSIHAVILGLYLFYVKEKITPEIKIPVVVEMSMVRVENGIIKEVKHAIHSLQDRPKMSGVIAQQKQEINTPDIQTALQQTAQLAPSVNTSDVAAPIEPALAVAIEQESALSKEQENKKEPESKKESIALKPKEPSAPSSKHSEDEFVKTNFGAIRDAVLSKLVYPNIARRMGHYGVVEIAIVIDTSGKIKKYCISKPSGYPILDEAALKAVLAQESLPIPRVESTVVLPISFKLSA